MTTTIRGNHGWEIDFSREQALYDRADALITVAISKGEKLLNQKAGD